MRRIPQRRAARIDDQYRRKGVRETIGLPGSGLGYQYLEYHAWNTRQKSSLDFTSSPHSVSSAFAQPRTRQAVKVAEWHEYTVGRQVRFKTPRVLMVAPREPVFTRTAVFQARMKVHAPRRTDSSYQNRNSVVRSYSADSSGRKTPIAPAVDPSPTVYPTAAASTASVDPSSAATGAWHVTYTGVLVSSGSDGADVSST